MKTLLSYCDSIDQLNIEIVEAHLFNFEWNSVCICGKARRSKTLTIIVKSKEETVGDL